MTVTQMRPDDRLLTLPEAAERLRKSEQQLRWMIHAAKSDPSKAPRSGTIGGRRMFRESDIEAFIAQAFGDDVA